MFESRLWMCITLGHLILERFYGVFKAIDFFKAKINNFFSKSKCLTSKGGQLTLLSWNRLFVYCPLHPVAPFSALTSLSPFA